MIDLYDLGTQSFHHVWEIQKSLQKELIEQKKNLRDGHDPSNQINDFFLFAEHPHVYTLGKSGNVSNLLKDSGELKKLNAEFIKIDRGGDITYHGPGQIVGYPILDLSRYFTDIHKYLRYLEETVIRTLAEYGLTGVRIDKLTGVWVDNKKICAMGIRCSRWVTMHGFALNVNTDLTYFDYIIPCGITNKSVTSLSELLQQEIPVQEVKTKLLNHFSEIFDVAINVKRSATDYLKVSIFEHKEKL